MNPVLKYRGGKLREIPAFIHQAPQRFNRYFEPFLGGGSVFFHLEPRRAVIGDVNGRLIAFYTQLRDHYPEMRRQLDGLQRTYEENQARFEELKRLHPDQRCENRNEALYYALREEYNHPTGQYLEGVLYFFINKTAYSGMLRFNASGEYNVPFGRYRHFNTAVVSQAHSALLQRAAVLHADYLQLFNMAQPGDFMFLDPPYDCVFNDYGNVQAADGFNEAAHRRLAADFQNLNCPALMVIGSTPLTEALYAPYVQGRYEKRYAVNIRNRFQSSATHMIVRNY